MLSDLARSPQQPSSIIKLAECLKVTTYRCEKDLNTTSPSFSGSNYVMMPTPANNSSISPNTSHSKGSGQITSGSDIDGQVLELVLEGAHATRWAVLTTLLRNVGDDDTSVFVQVVDVGELTRRHCPGGRLLIRGKRWSQGRCSIACIVWQKTLGCGRRQGTAGRPLLQHCLPQFCTTKTSSVCPRKHHCLSA